MGQCEGAERREKPMDESSEQPSTAGPSAQPAGEAMGRAFLGGLAQLVAPTVLASLNPAQRMTTAQPHTSQMLASRVATSTPKVATSDIVASPPLHGLFDDPPHSDYLRLPGTCFDSIREDARLGR